MDVFRRFEVPPVRLNIAAERPAGDEGVELDPFAFPGQKNGVARVVGDPRAKLALQPVALFRANFGRNIEGHIMDPDALEPVTEPDISEIGDRFARIQRKAVTTLVIDIRDKRRIPVKELAAEGDLVVEKIGLGEREDEIFAPGAVLDAHPEFLAATGEIRPPGNIEVALGDLRKTDQIIDRRKAGAEVERTGPFLFDEHIE